MSKGAFTKVVKLSAFNRDGEGCARCRQGLSFEMAQFHHRRPRGAGGTSNPVIGTAANCLTLCMNCHAWVESQRELALSTGFLVSQFRDPREVAVRHAVWGAVHLTSRGTVVVAGVRLEEEWK